MKVRLTLLGAAMLAASPLSARESTDAILMKNGDRITCEIKGLRSNTLYISVPYVLGTLSVDWSRVDHIESKQLFIVKTQDGTVYTGALSTTKIYGERPTQLEILETPEKKVSLERKEVVEVSETAHGFWQRLNGQIGAGFTYSKGNESTQYNLNSDVDYPRERWSAGASYSSNFTSKTGSSPSKRNEVTLSAERLMRWNNWYYTGLAGFLQSSVQGIQLQSTFGGGHRAKYQEHWRHLFHSLWRSRLAEDRLRASNLPGPHKSHVGSCRKQIKALPLRPDHTDCECQFSSGHFATWPNALQPAVFLLCQVVGQIQLELHGL